ncbi:Zinc finger DNL-type [Arabidopsis suecica]|uniref:Zinc finger DNL-type n=1 Tax=Arabidopsis suecica TaxID=45249 RepID=A0A8T2BSI8_ARASU|nr:Zinc finger DNL-type [Arabidopsis suecica]
MANTAAGCSPVLPPIYSPISAHTKPISASFYKPPRPSYQHHNPISALHRSKTTRVIEVVAPKQRNRSVSVFGSLPDDSKLNPDEESKDSQLASIDIKLPRRSLLVEFSCDSCGERTKRLINRHAYENGLVFVQCAGCLQHHKLVDNLGLIVEYDFRETSKDSGTDQV